MRKLKLTVNEEKTHVCRAPDESFDFLGYTFGTCYSRRNGWRYITERPSKKKIQAICRRISELTNRRWCWRDVDEQVGQLNQIMVGWANYFCLGPDQPTVPDRHRTCLPTGSVSGCVRSTRCRVGHFHATRTNTCTRSLAWSSFVCLIATSRGRTHESLSESRMREIRTSGLMSGRWKRNKVMDIRAPATERAGNRPSLHLNHRATSRLYHLELSR